MFITSFFVNSILSEILTTHSIHVTHRLDLFNPDNTFLLATMRHHTGRPLSNLGRIRHLSCITVKDNSHLLKRVSLGFRKPDIDRDAVDDEDDDKDNVVPPSDFFQGDGVDKSVEADGEDGGDVGDSETTRTETVGPDLTRV